MSTLPLAIYFYWIPARGAEYRDGVVYIFSGVQIVVVISGLELRLKHDNSGLRRRPMFRDQLIFYFLFSWSFLL